MRRWRKGSRAGDRGRWLSVALCAALSCACEPALAAKARIQPVVARGCLVIDSSHAVAVNLTTPADGLLRVEVEERGISTVSFLHDGAHATAASAAASPIDRLGTVVLVANVRRGTRAEVEVHVEDSRDIRGEVCI